MNDPDFCQFTREHDRQIRDRGWCTECGLGVPDLEGPWAGELPPARHTGISGLPAGRDLQRWETVVDFTPSGVSSTGSP